MATAAVLSASWSERSNRRFEHLLPDAIALMARAADEGQETLFSEARILFRTALERQGRAHIGAFSRDVAGLEQAGRRRRPGVRDRAPRRTAPAERRARPLRFRCRRACQRIERRGRRRRRRGDRGSAQGAPEPL